MKKHQLLIKWWRKLAAWNSIHSHTLVHTPFGMFIVINSTLDVTPRFLALASAELIFLIELQAEAISIANALFSYRVTSRKSTEDRDWLQSTRTANAPEDFSRWFSIWNEIISAETFGFVQDVRNSEPLEPHLIPTYKPNSFSFETPSGKINLNFLFSLFGDATKKSGNNGKTSGWGNSRTGSSFKVRWLNEWNIEPDGK